MLLCFEKQNLVKVTMGTSVVQLHVYVCVCVPLAVCRGVQRPAGGCRGALLRHTQHLQTLPLWPAATVTGQHGRVHTLPWRICTHKIHRASTKSTQVNLISIYSGAK